MTIIIGIDPGSRTTGYGIINTAGAQPSHITHGAIHAGSGEIAERLAIIFSELKTVVMQYNPDVLAAEQVFVHQNMNTALKLGHARGAAIVACHGLPLSEYAPRKIKQTITGYGGAEKKQVAHMIGKLLNLKEPLQADAADALAVAYTHALHSRIACKGLV